MLKRLLSLVTSDYYGKKTALKVFSKIHLVVSLFLLALPFFYSAIFDIIFSYFNNASSPIPPDVIIKNVGYVMSILIAISSFLVIVREYLLSDQQIIGRDFQKEHVRLILNLLMDAYNWKGTCRATFFRPNGKKIQIYERISAGIGPGDFSANRCFFRMGQGLPGKAWKDVWSGDRDDTLIKAIQLGNVPQNEFNSPTKARKFFLKTFNIVDHDIYESLGEAKSKIRSYMAVGIVGKNQELIGVLSIDSEEKEKFLDFEQLKVQISGKGVVRKQTNETTLKLHGHGHGHGHGNGKEIFDRLDDMGLPDVIKKMLPVIKNPKLLREKIENSNVDQASNLLYNVAIYKQTMDITGKLIIPDDIKSFLFPLNWALKQLREFFIQDF